MSKTTEVVAVEAAETMHDAIQALELFAESRTPLAGKIRNEAISALKGHAQTLRQVGGATPLRGQSTAELVDRPLTHDQVDVPAMRTVSR